MIIPTFRIPTALSLVTVSFILQSNISLVPAVSIDLEKKHSCNMAVCDKTVELNIDNSKCHYHGIIFDL